MSMTNDIQGLKETMKVGFADVQEQLNVMQKEIVMIKGKVDQHTGARIEIQNTIIMFGEAYDINYADINRLDKRVTHIEDQL